MKKRHRIFIAINLPYEIKKQLGKYQKQWQDLPAKWVSQDNLHITLVFLGDLTDIELAEACKVAKDVSLKHNYFEIHLENVSYGPDNKIPPKMVWVSGQKSKELSDLKNNLQESLLEKINFVPENRGFTPHITLARILAMPWRAMEMEERPEINEQIELVFTVESIEVMQSELKRGGPQYTVIESHQLQ